MSNELHLALGLVAMIADRFGASSRISREVPSWLSYLAEVECPERPEQGPAGDWWHAMRRLTHELVPEGPGIEERTVRRNISMIGAHFGLNAVETQILLFYSAYRLFDPFEHVVDGMICTREVSWALLLSQFTGADEHRIRAALHPASRLQSSGLLERKRYSSDLGFEVGDRLAAAVLTEAEGVEDLIARLFPAASAPEATWQDFEGMARDALFLKDLLGRALHQGRKGVNVLLYGPPGTGKTEFCKVLAAEVGASLRTVCETDQNGADPQREERLAELVMAGKMLDCRRDTILLFDEMEYLVGSSDPFGGGRRLSKVHLNRLLETNPVPTLWTTNSVEACDPAILRRMTYSVWMKAPVGAVRSRIWRRLERRHGTGIPDDRLRHLAAELNLAPALVSDAMAVARLCDGGEAVLTQVLDAAQRLAEGGDPPPKIGADAMWQPGLANADADLLRLEDRLSREGASKRVSLCLEGPPGTGKSAWARHLARRIGLPVVEKRASELLSKWVGESEKRIAEAFAEAREASAMLIFDEADTLLGDRRGASQPWQVSQVNEMLTWMECHPLPFVCTTNFAAHLDPATQRRFTFRIRFDWLRTDQLRPAWRGHFDVPPPDGLGLLDRLAAGDFANVRRRMAVLDEAAPERILAELAREAAGHDDAPRPIGFLC